MMGRRHTTLASVSVIALLLAGGVQTAAAADAASTDSGSDVIVTGTREAGRKVQDSPTPVQVVGADALLATGQVNTLDALKALLPSLNTISVGGDVGNMIRSFALRGLSPDHVLVLVNGKRRHQSAYIYATSGPFQGANTVDLALIPVSAIDHIEVLTDGATAQYGTDAIAGVINIILKNSDHASTLSALGGVTGGGDGGTGQFDADTGAKLGEDGFIHLSADYEHHDYTNRSALDPRTNYLVRGKIIGDAAYDTESLAFNLEKPVDNDITAYGFGTFAHREASSIQNFRTATQLNAAVTAFYPNGFFPVMTSDEYDFGVTAGVKGKSLLGWEWDLSSTYGYDTDRIGTIKSINPVLLQNTGNAQTNFYDGTFTSQQLTNNLDFRRGFDTGLWGSPLNVAFGFEHRYEAYQVGAGELTSYELGGATAYPGFTPTSASNTSRNVEAAYVDLSTHFTQKWQVDLSGRGETYEDVGGALTGKLASRYDFTSWLGVRGSVGNGYHAPTLAQDNFATTNVSPTSATAQLPVDSPGAKLLGASSLKPETSQNFSVGLVSEPIPRLHATLDAYQISIHNRIIDTGVLTGALSPLAIAAIEANGNILPAGISTSNIGAQFFVNGVDTKTQGIDLNVDYMTDHGNYGIVKWLLTGDYNNTTITHINPAPAAMQAAGLSLVSPASISYLTTAVPRDRISLGATWYIDQWEVTLRETRYEGVKEWVNPSGNGKTFLPQRVDPAFLTDLNVRYNISDRWAVDVGALNLFNVEPNKTPLATRTSNQSGQYATFSPYGIDGGYYFARITVKF